MKTITLDDIKNIITKQGCIVSEIPPIGPVTVLFTRPKNPSDKIWYYENQILEMGYFDLTQDGLEGFEQEVKHIKDQFEFTPIFSLYGLLTDENNHLQLRYAHSYGMYYEAVEVTIEEARDMINDPTKYLDHAFLSFIQDLKTVYRL